MALYAPATILRNNAHSIAFFLHFQMGCVAGCILMEKWVKSPIFNMAAIKKCRNIKNRNSYSSNSNYHNYTNLTSKYMFLRVTNEMKLFQKILPHHLRAQNPRWPLIFNIKSFLTPNPLISHSSYCFKLAQYRFFGYYICLQNKLGS